MLLCKVDRLGGNGMLLCKVDRLGGNGMLSMLCGVTGRDGRSFQKIRLWGPLGHSSVHELA